MPSLGLDSQDPLFTSNPELKAFFLNENPTPESGRELRTGYLKCTLTEEGLECETLNPPIIAICLDKLSHFKALIQLFEKKYMELLDRKSPSKLPVFKAHAEKIVETAHISANPVYVNELKESKTFQSFFFKSHTNSSSGEGVSKNFSSSYT